MRIVQANLQRDYGGAEIHVRMLAAGLKARGHDLRLLCHPHGRLRTHAERDGIPAIPFLVRGQVAPLATLRLAACLRRDRPDLLHLHTPKEYLCGVLAARMAQVPVVLTRHMLLPLKPMMRTLYRQSDAVVCLSRGLQNLLQSQGLPLEKLPLIYGAIDVTPFTIAAKRRDTARLRAEWGVKENILMIGCVGRMVHGKGQATLLDAFARCVSREPALALILVGDGPEREALQARAAQLGVTDAVRFPGFRDDIPDVLAAMDIVVVPSTTTELLPLSVMEAMAAGRAVVAADVGGVPEIVSEATLGRLTPPGDVDALAEALLSLITGPALRRQLGTAAAAHICARFALPRLLDETEALYALIQKQQAQ